jgi:tRNA(fMet)-specific endonuclease VapC
MPLLPSSKATLESLARVEALAFEVLEFDRKDARAAGERRASLAKAGTPIGPYDGLIADGAIGSDAG